RGAPKEAAPKGESAARLHLSQRGWARAIVLLPLTVLTAVAWLVTCHRAENMNAPMMSAGMEMSGTSMMTRPIGGAVEFLPIWFIMMTAMMVPSEVPMLLTLALESRRRGKEPFVSTWLFAGGYLIIWVFTGVAAYFVLWAGSALASDLAAGYREPVECLTLAVVLMEAGFF